MVAMPSAFSNIAANSGFQLLVRPFLMIFNWKGRATRREVVIAFVMMMAFIFSGLNTTGNTFMALIFFINCGIGLTIFAGTAVRRMHDIARSGWAMLIICLPYVGWLVALVFLFFPPDDDAIHFGPDPRDYFG